MNSSIGTSRALCAFLLSGSAALASGQVYIENEDYRRTLNLALGGLVDASGHMNTDHPGIAELDTLWLSISVNGPATIELNGLEYLTAVRYLRILPNSGNGETVTLIVPQCPPDLDNLHVQGRGAVTVSNPPSTLSSLYVIAPNADSEGLFVTMDEPPVEIGTLRISEYALVDWNGSVSVGDARIGFDTWPLQDLVLPSMMTDRLFLNYVRAGDIDLGAVTTARVEGYLSVLGGQLTWPTGVTNMTIGLPGLMSLPPWPSTLDSLRLRDGTSCLPPFPASLQSLEFEFGYDCLPNWPPLLDSVHLYSGSTTYGHENTVRYCSVLNSDCPGANPGVTGRVFIDLNADGDQDPSEPGLPQAYVTILPNENMLECEMDGTWEIGVQPGEYTITAASGYPYIQNIAPATQSASVPNMGDIDMNNDFAVTLIPDIQDLRAHVHANVARPGFDNQVYLHCENYGTTPVDAEVTLIFDADQTWLGSSVAPSTTSGNTATWSFPAMPIGAVRNIMVELNTAATVPLGTEIVHTLTADPTASDETPLDNTYTFTDSVIGSYDPNDKLLSPARLTPDEVATGDKPIEYTIRFQNTGTYHAERVVILDTLSEDLQWSSMSFIASSHANRWYITDGTLHVIHDDIMLPDSTADEAGSHGFFTFSMLPKAHLGNGRVIENIAHIVFDFNEPIITPPAVFTVDAAMAIADGSTETGMRIVPNPAHDRIQLHTADPGAVPYRIINTLGQPLANGLLAPHTWVDVRALPPGLYILEVGNRDQAVSLRFVKQ